MMKYTVKFLAVAALLVAPLALTQLGIPARAAVALQTIQNCTPDQLLACVNTAVQGVNNSAPTCVGTGCQVPTSGPNAGAVPVITGTCATAGGATSAMLGTSNNAQGRVTCTSTANTTATLTWATARASQPVCTIIGETTPVLTVGTNSLTVLAWTYASTASPVFDYVCMGQ